MPAGSTGGIIVDGTVDFAAGVDSITVPTVVSALNPGGLPRNAQAWLNNCSVRDGGILQRTGWQWKGRIHDGSALYQGGFMYEPLAAYPYPVVSIGGEIWKVDPDFAVAPVNLSQTATGVYGPTTGTPATGYITPYAQQTTLTAPFTCPALGATGSVTVADTSTICSPLAPLFWWSGAPLGIYPWSLRLVSIDSPTSITVQNLWAGNAGTASAGTPVRAQGWITTAPAIPPTPGGPNPPLTNPPAQPHAYFCQAEEFLVIQAGDNQTAPLFWDDSILRRSRGITDNAIVTPAPNINEIPAATAMTYYMGRLWYAQGRTYSAGDIVKNHNSGTAIYEWRDSILNVTENPLCFGGDGFTIPTAAGNIRALFYNANLNTQLGQGQLLIGSRKAVYTLQVPQSRADWINATANNQPLQTVVQLVNGPVNDRSVVLINGDVFYQTLEPGITSLLAAIRDFQGWGNHAISSNEDRILSFNDRALLLESSGIAFDNRMLQTALPKQTPQGVVHQALIPLDFIPINNFTAQQTQTQPVWEGMYEGLDILQMFTGDFGGRERAFAVVVSRVDGGIDLWELTDYLRSDFQKPTPGSDGEARVTWIVETPAWTWSRAGAGEFDLKELETLELWIDKLFGEVIFKVEWRPDSDPCWRLWHEWKECQPRTSCESPEDVCYPLTQCREGFRATMTLPKPPVNCGSNTGRPAHIGYQHQLRFTIKGWARLRGLLVHATKRERELFKNMVC